MRRLPKFVSGRVAPDMTWKERWAYAMGAAQGAMAVTVSPRSLCFVAFLTVCLSVIYAIVAAYLPNGHVTGK